MDIFKKLEILADSAKYDVACTSSGVDRTAMHGGLGSTVGCGICHSFAADGRCVSLLKVLMTNSCVYDCKYCVNRRSNDTPRTTFTPRELAELTIHFYKRNYIEGLFVSSGVLKNADHTTELMIETLRILRREYRFSGYIHAKGIPGASEELLNELGLLADRMSVNIEMPSSGSLRLLAPDKTKQAVLQPMRFIRDRKRENKNELALYRRAPKFLPAGQSTQMIIGATPETDLQILNLTEGLYKKYALKRVFFSAYMPVVEHSLLPALNAKPQLLREHRLYQADWLLRFYQFTASEILDEKNPSFNPFIDPKCNWALYHMELFPLEVNRASYEELLRVPGIGVTSAKRIVRARRTVSLDFDALKKLGVVLKRAKYFLTCRGKVKEGVHFKQEEVLGALMSKKEFQMYRSSFFLPDGTKQLSLFEPPAVLGEDVQKCLTGQI
ncbi:MAG TPA: putative DNA modification/repair radical SAM protein [Clostridiales bacterium]|nr:putative DNA modification/repair radical SAM protein [Clostridiales bacterium]